MARQRRRGEQDRRRAHELRVDGNSNLTSVTPPGQPAHGQSFTPVDLLSAYTPPSVPGVPVPSTLFRADLDQQLTQTTRPDGLLVGRIYDSAGKLDLLTTPAGNVDYDYFGLTPCPGCAPGRLQRITDPSGVVLDYVYDGLLLKSLTWSGAVAGSVCFGHDSSFRSPARRSLWGRRGHRSRSASTTTTS